MLRQEPSCDCSKLNTFDEVSIAWLYWDGNNDGGPGAGLGLIVQDNTEKRAIYLQPAVVVDETQFSEFVHEEIHS